MSVCSIVNNPSLDFGWTSKPVDYYGSYTTYYASYQATLSTTVTFTDIAMVTLTMLCMTTQPSDFTLRLVSGDGYKFLSEPCPTNVTGNATSTLGYYDKGTMTITLEIAVQADQPSSQWLEISDIWLEACYDQPDFNPGPVIVGVGVFFLVVAILAIAIYCKGQKNRFEPLEQREMT